MENEVLQQQVEEGESVRSMMMTEGWKIVEKNLKEQLEAYVADNATSAKDWDDYLKKSGKIFGIQLLLVDLADYIRAGDQAKEELSKNPKSDIYL